MRIIDLLSPSRIGIGIKAASKKAVLEELARLAGLDRDELTPAQAFDALVARERLGSTGFGNGIAIPHGRIDHLQKMAGAFLRTESPIDFDAIDNQPVDIFFALFVPNDTTNEHLKALSDLATLFSDDAFVARLRDLPDADAAYTLLTERALESS